MISIQPRLSNPAGTTAGLRITFALHNYLCTEMNSVCCNLFPPSVTVSGKSPSGASAGTITLN